MKKIEFKPLYDLVTHRDLLNLQDLAQKMFTNFNGGFGLYNHTEYVLRCAPKCSESIGISFTSNSLDFNEIQMRKFNEIGIPSKTENIQVHRYEWQYVLEVICQELNVFFRLTPNGINDCINIFESK